jgi:hypothetical protein
MQHSNYMNASECQAHCEKIEKEVL